VAHPGHYRDRA